MEMTLKVTKAVAEKVYGNVHKGLPPLKPDHGEHGGCSWALFSGNPYAGQLIERTVDLTVTIPDQYVDQTEYPKQKVKQTKNGPECLLTNKLAFIGNQNRDAHIRVIQAKVWDAVGEHVRASVKAMLLYVPSGPMSNGEGYFVVIPPAVEPHVTMSPDDVDALMTRIKVWRATFEDDLEEADEAKERRRKDLTVLLTATAQNELPGQWNALGALIPAPAATVEQPVQAIAPKVVGGWVPGKALTGAASWTQQKVLTFATYRDARNAFKALRKRQRHPQGGLRLTVAPPNDWPAKLQRIFEERQ